MTDDFSTSGSLLNDPASSDDLGEIRFRRQRDVGDIINVTFRFLRDNLREIAVGMLYIVGPVALLAAVLSFFVQSQMQASMFDFTNIENNPFEIYSSIFTPAYFGYILLLMVVLILVTSVVLGYISLYREGRAGEIAPSLLWAEASHMIGPIIALFLLVGLFATLSFVVWIVPCLGAIAWLAAVVYLFPSLSMATVSRVLDEDSAMGALKRPYQLVKGQWGMSFGTMAIAVIAFMAIATLLSVPGAVVGFGSAMGSLTGDDPGGGSRVLLAIGSLLSTLTYLGYTIPLVAGAFLYFNLIERKEGAGLFADIDLIDSAPTVVEEPDDLELRGPSPPGPDPGARDSGFRDGGFRHGGFRGGGFDEGQGS
ncbi:MAG: hypothetical protein IH855_00885 [Bacteroidetes bacterium]|nr:hypothetical protein [Bacteroidota bacterium]